MRRRVLNSRAPKSSLLSGTGSVESAGATQAGRAAGRRSGARAPLSGPTAPAPGPPARRPLQPRWGGTGAWALSPGLRPRGARAQARLAKPPKTRTPRMGGVGWLEGLRTEQPPRRRAPDPGLRLLVFCLKAVSLPLSPSLFLPFSLHAISLSLT